MRQVFLATGCLGSTGTDAKRWSASPQMSLLGATNLRSVPAADRQPPTHPPEKLATHQSLMCDRLPKLILASRSPRRRELLLQAGYSFEVRPPQEVVECGLGHRSETVLGGESPAELVARLAFQKAADVARSTPSGLILGCDTVVECRGKILGKPVDKDHAREMLRTLSGLEHRVLSGLCLWRISDGRSLVRVAATILRMDQLTDEQLDEYLTSGAWQGKAGAFGYQDRLGWVHVIEGSESNVVGLPLELLAEMLAQFEVENGPLAADHSHGTNRGAEKGRGHASQRPG